MANAFACDQCRTVLLVGEEDGAGWIRFSRLGVASRDDSEFRYPRHFCSPRCAGAWMLRLVEPLELTATSGEALPANGEAPRDEPIEVAVAPSEVTGPTPRWWKSKGHASPPRRTAAPHPPGRGDDSMATVGQPSEPLRDVAVAAPAAPAPPAELKAPPADTEIPPAETEAPFAAPPARVPAGHREDLPPAPKSEGAEAPRVRLRDLLEGAPSVDLEALAREQGKKRSRFGGRR